MDNELKDMPTKDVCRKSAQGGAGVPCEEMPRLSTYVRRFMRTKLGTIFTLVICIAVGLFVVNYAGSILGRSNSGSVVSSGRGFDSPAAGRGLAGFEHPGGHHRRPGHRKHGSGTKGLQVCRVPKLSLESDANKEAFHPMTPLSCPGEQLFYVHMGNLRLNHTVLAGRKLERCEFRSIEWVNDHFHQYSKTYVRKHEPFDIKVSHDFFRVECFLEQKHKAKRQVDNEINEYHARRLLQAKSEPKKPFHIASEGEIVNENSPNLVGSFGVPDMGNNILKNHAQNSIHKEDTEVEGEDHFVDNEHHAPGDHKVGQQSHKHSDTQHQPETDLQGQGKPQQPKEIENPETKKKEQEDTSTKNKVVEKSVEEKEVNAAENMDDEGQPGNDEQDDDAENQHNLENYEDGDPFDTDFEAESPDFDQFVAQIHVKEEVQERLQEQKASKNALKMNVLILILDSMSHMSYQRKLPKTYNYLKEVLSSNILNGYNIVGDATLAALIPLLTGKTEMELPEARLNKDASQYVDIFPFIWNKYEQNGYVTLYAEDRPDLGTFQLRHNGFEQPPVDHYMRHFWQAAEESDLHHNSPQFCLGSVPEHKYVLDYLRQFFMRYRSFPKFALSLLVELSHADNNPAEYIDRDMVDFLEFLRKSQALDNTLLVVMGDHGARYSKVRGTVQGKLEERMPFMSLTMPQWFQDKYPDLYTNLKRNSMKLTTPFDVHETLRDILDISRPKLPVHQSDRGISLFQSIPRNRTCESAGIDMHWCTCLQSEPVEITEPLVQDAAKKLLSHINQLTEPVRDKCEELRLQDILDARIIIPNEQVLKFQKSIDPDQRIANFSKQYKLDVLHHQVILETAPNAGHFEGTVQLNMALKEHSITGTVSRINMYGNQSACIAKTHPDLLKYCYCRQQQAQAKQDGAL